MVEGVQQGLVLCMSTLTTKAFVILVRALGRQHHDKHVGPSSSRSTTSHCRMYRASRMQQRTPVPA